jgi:broad specificity phosphatase PhoE
MEIVLARHGRPRLGNWRWIAARRLSGWILAYDQAGVFVDDVPGLLRAKALQCGRIVSSSLPRCMQSAEALGPARLVSSEDLFREAGLPHANWASPRLPPSIWAVFFRAAWFLGYSANSESLESARIRARTGAMRLIDLAAEHESVFLMGHGIMAVLIAKELTRRGWKGPRRPAHGVWQFSVYSI